MHPTPPSFGGSDTHTRAGSGINIWNPRCGIPKKQLRQSWNGTLEESRDMRPNESDLAARTAAPLHSEEKNEPKKPTGDTANTH